MLRQVASSKRQAAAAIWQFAACHKNVYGTRNLTPGESRGPISPARAHFVRMEKRERKGGSKNLQFMQFSWKICHAKRTQNGEQRTGQGQHNIFMCIRICALNVKMFVCLAFQALNFCCQRSSQKRVSISVYIFSEQQRYF